MNDNLTLVAEDNAMLARLALTALAQLLTGTAPGMVLSAEPLAGLVALLDNALICPCTGDPS